MWFQYVNGPFFFQSSQLLHIGDHWRKLMENLPTRVGQLFGWIYTGWYLPIASCSRLFSDWFLHPLEWQTQFKDFEFMEDLPAGVHIPRTTVWLDLHWLILAHCKFHPAIFWLVPSFTGMTDLAWRLSSGNSLQRSWTVQRNSPLHIEIVDVLGGLTEIIFRCKANLTDGKFVDFVNVSSDVLLCLQNRTRRETYPFRLG